MKRRVAVYHSFLYAYLYRDSQTYGGARDRGRIACAHQAWLAARVLTQALFGRNGRPITGLAGWSTREVAGRIDRSRAARGVGGTK